MVVNTLCISQEARVKVCKELGITKETLRQDIEVIKDWLLKQPHLPDLSSLNLDHWLENWLLLTKNSVERTKMVVDFNISARSFCPALFTNRDASDNMIRESFNHVTLAVLPGVTEDGYRVFILKITDPDPERYDFMTVIKRCSLILETLLKDDVDFKGIHIVHDFQNLKLGHLTKFNLTLMKVMTLGMKAYPFRTPRVSMVNIPSFLDKLLTLFRPFVAAKIMSRVSICKDYSLLGDLIPADILPKDYGGNGLSLQAVNALWLEKLDQNKEYFTLCNAIKSDERKRVGKGLYTQTDYGENGSFRQLSVD